MLDQLAGYLQATWAYVLREPVKVVVALGLVVPVVLIGLNNVRESSRQSAVEKELPQLERVLNPLSRANAALFFCLAMASTPWLVLQHLEYREDELLGADVALL